MTTNNSLNINTVTPLDLSRGGSSASLTASNGGMIYSSASAMAVLAGTSTAQQLLLSGASGAPLWSTTTYPTTNAINTLLYASSANVMGALATGNNGVLITDNSGIPSWLANSGTPGFVLAANAGAPPSWQNISSGSITIAGDIGSVTGNSITLTAENGANNAGSSVNFNGSVATMVFNLSDGNNNTLLGIGAGNFTLSGSNNTSLGWNTLPSLTTGGSNTALGGQALQALAGGSNNIAIGFETLFTTGSDSDNIGIGNFALYILNGGSQNVAIGSSALTSSTDDSNIVAIGYHALTAANGVTNAVAIGSGAQAASAADADNTAVGFNALTAQNGGGENTAIGASSLLNATSCSSNTTLGSNTLKALITGNNNIAIGSSALTASTADGNNTAVGYVSLSTLNGGVGNTTLGYLTGQNLTTGNYNLFLGFQSGDAYTSSESANIAINTHGNETAGESHTLRIGASTGTGGLQSLAHVYICGITGTTPVSANSPEIMLCDNANNITVIGSGSSGQVLTSNGSATPSFQAISATLLWTIQTTSFTAAVTQGYFVGGTSTTVTLPSGSAVGQTIELFGESAGSMTVRAATGQVIRIDSGVSSSGGTATSTGRGDYLKLVYNTTGAAWYCDANPVANWTLA